MLGRFRSRKKPSSPSLFHRFHTMFKRRGRPTAQSEKNPHSLDRANHPNEWNLPLPPDLMYHIIDTYLAKSTLIALSAAIPVLRPYCHPRPYRHMDVYIHKVWLPSQTHVGIKLSESPLTLEQDNSIYLSTRHDLGYATSTEKAHGVLSLVRHLTHDLTSIYLSVSVRWNELDEYVKVYIFALLQRSGLRSVKLETDGLPVNLLGVVQNLKTLDVNDISLGHPNSVSLSGERGKVYVEELRLNGGLCLFGTRTPFNWSRLRSIEYTRCRGGPQELLKLCSSSLQVLKLSIDGEDGEQLFIPDSPQSHMNVSYSQVISTLASTSAFLPASVISHYPSVLPILLNRQCMTIPEPTPQSSRFGGSPTYWRPAMGTTPWRKSSL